MGDGFVGEIRLFAGDFVPQEWVLCDGALRSVGLDGDSPLQFVIGNRFGGDGVNTYGMPNLPDPAPGLRYVICLYGVFPAQSGSPGGPQGYLGEVRLSAVGYSPEGWNYCDGSVIPFGFDPYLQALFSLIGTKFGGDGIRTFGLPTMPDPAPGVKRIICLRGSFPQ